MIFWGALLSPNDLLRSFTFTEWSSEELYFHRMIFWGALLSPNDLLRSFTFTEWSSEELYFHRMIIWGALLSPNDLLRSFTFTEWSSEELYIHRMIFWGALLSPNDHLMSFTFISHLLRSVCFFISQSALHYMFGSFTSHLTKTYYCRYRAIFRSCYVTICSTVV